MSSSKNKSNYYLFIYFVYLLFTECKVSTAPIAGSKSSDCPLHCTQGKLKWSIGGRELTCKFIQNMEIKESVSESVVASRTLLQYFIGAHQQIYFIQKQKQKRGRTREKVTDCH